VTRAVGRSEPEPSASVNLHEFAAEPEMWPRTHALARDIATLWPGRHRRPLNGQMVGRGSGAGVAKGGGLPRSMKSVSGLAAASRRVRAGRFHFSSMVARIDV